MNLRLNDWMRDALEYRDIDRAALEAAEKELAAQKPQYIPLRLAGRCANGFERGHGSVYHALPLESEQHGQGKALCGKRPGPRSAGWAARGEQVTCPTCKRRLEKQATAANE